MVEVPKNVDHSTVKKKEKRVSGIHGTIRQ